MISKPVFAAASWSPSVSLITTESPVTRTRVGTSAIAELGADAALVPTALRVLTVKV